MHRISRIAALPILLVVLAPPSAGAESLPDSCKDIKKGDAAACKKEADTSCASIKAYWDKVKCEGAIAQKHSACVSGGYVEACQQPQRDYWDICRKAHDLDMNKPESIEEWRRRLIDYERRAKKEFKAFHDEWSACFATVDGCQVTAAWLEDCEGAQEVFKKTFAEAVDFFLATGFAQTKERIDEAMKSKDYNGASQWAESLSDRIMVFVDLNKELESVRHRSEEITKALAGVKASQQKAKKGIEKALASRICPAGQNQDPALTKVLRPAVDSFFHDFGDTKVQAKVFRLNGTKSTETIAHEKLTKESVPAIVCTEKKTPIETYCQSFNVTLRRQKFKDHPWGDWKVFVGSSERMLCKKVR